MTETNITRTLPDGFETWVEFWDSVKYRLSNGHYIFTWDGKQYDLHFVKSKAFDEIEGKRIKRSDFKQVEIAFKNTYKMSPFEQQILKNIETFVDKSLKDW